MAFWTKKPEESTASSTPAPQMKSPQVTPATPVAPIQSIAVPAQPVAPVTNATVAAPADPAERWANLGKIRTAISSGTSIEGKLNFDSPVQIDGNVRGGIVSSQTLTFGTSAQIEAAVAGPVIVVHGKISGEIKASERIELKSGAIVSGTIRAGTLVLEEGAVLNASLYVGSFIRTTSERLVVEKIVDRNDRQAKVGVPQMQSKEMPAQPILH